MNTDRPASTESLLRAAARLDDLRAFRGPPNEFWPACLETLATLAGGADAAALVIPAEPTASSSDGAATVPTRWRVAWEWRAGTLPDGRLNVFRGGLRLAAESCGPRGGATLDALTGNERAAAGAGWIAAVQLDAGAEGRAIVVLLLPALEGTAAEEGLRRVRLAADVARAYGLHRRLETAERNVQTFASALDLVTLLDAESKFAAAAMTLCNELASRHQCQRVSLAWRKGPYLRLRAVSHMEKFEPRMTIVRQLEAAMEEASDQDAEIIWPPAYPLGGVGDSSAETRQSGDAAGSSASETLITRDHEIYAGEQKSGHLVTLPLRVGTRSVGAITCERAENGFGVQEVRHLRLAADHATRRLDALERAEAWFGQRWMRRAREQLAGLLGVEHTLAKAGAIAGALVLAWSVVWRIDYRVEAPFSLRGAETAVLTAPFDGYLASSLVEKGDAVEAGAVLATLDQTELALELSAAQADATRFDREVQQARSEGKLAEMQIAQARADQAKARLEILRLRLAQCEIRAGFDGVIVEGELRERIGAPLKQGDALFRLARLKHMYAEVLVKEVDVRDITVGARGELAFASRPALRFPVTIERIEPLAQTRPEGNVFLVRCTLPAEAQSWWRPGMSGVARLNAGSHMPLWIATHRTIDYLRLRWW